MSPWPVTQLRRSSRRGQPCVSMARPPIAFSSRTVWAWLWPGHGAISASREFPATSISAPGSGDLRLESLSGSINVGEADGDVRADGVAGLRLTGACHGDLRFETGGTLTVESLSGDLRVSGATEVSLGRVHGDLWAEKVIGGLRLDRADGAARLDDIRGVITLRLLAGDLRASKLVGGLVATRVNGDVQLNGPFGSIEGYTVSADGDIQIHLPAEADLRLVVRAGGRIRSDVPLSPAADGLSNFSGAVGRGAGRMTLTARGDVRVAQDGAEAAATSWERRGRAGSDSFAELSGLGDRIRQQVTASLAAAGINMETGEINVGRGARPPRTPPPSERAKPSPPAASAAEQMAILKMVEDGKITPEEADTLLKALGA